MLTRLTPVQYDFPARGGRTEPSFITCELPDGTAVEVVAKFSRGCDEGNINLAREVIAACLAGDLGLPVPEPFLIEMSPEWVDTIPDPARRTKAQRSSSIAFGSRVMTGQFVKWGQGNRITDTMLPVAAAIFLFDGIIQNPDRKSGDNPNCLVRGDEIRIFDHELAFFHGPILGWKAPWMLGGLNYLATNGGHVFHDGLRKRAFDPRPIRTAWLNLSDEKIADYNATLPEEWADAADAAVWATKLIRDARDNIDACLEEMKRVLS